MRLIDADTLKNDLNIEFIFDNRDRHRVRDLIDIQTTIKVEPARRGRWEVVDGAEPRRYGCSECKVLSFYPYDYCPNCGAKMEEE